MKLRDFAPARTIGPAALLAALIAASPPAARAAQAGDHQSAEAALHGLRAAIAQIVQADASFSTNRALYHQAAQRAVTAIKGAIGHIDHLLDRTATPVWAEPLRAAETNMRAAIAQFAEATRAKELMDYELAVSRALADLEVAQGRPTETGVFGGLEGALANTELGIPDGARIVDACAAPSAAPAYGTHGGYLAWVSVPAANGVHKLAENPGGTELEMRHGMIVLRTAAWPIVAKACGGMDKAAAQPSQMRSAVAPAAAPASPQTASSSLPKLYTMAQAEAGKEVFAVHCVSCHGSNLQGVAAPSVAGNDFLKTAKQDGWTVSVIRYIVFNLMPKNAAKALTPTQYADAMAYLLASSCYPAGTTKFPTGNEPSLAKIKLAPVPGHPPGQNAVGVCPVD